MAQCWRDDGAPVRLDRVYCLSSRRARPLLFGQLRHGIRRVPFRAILRQSILAAIRAGSCWQMHSPLSSRSVSSQSLVAGHRSRLRTRSVPQSVILETRRPGAAQPCACRSVNRPPIDRTTFLPPAATGYSRFCPISWYLIDHLGCAWGGAFLHTDLRRIEAGYRPTASRGCILGTRPPGRVSSRNSEPPSLRGPIDRSTDRPFDRPSDHRSGFTPRAPEF